jgi:hypothetical protein
MIKRGYSVTAAWMVTPMGETAYTAYVVGAGIIATLLLAMLSLLLFKFFQVLYKFNKFCNYQFVYTFPFFR